MVPFFFGLRDPKRQRAKEHLLRKNILARSKQSKQRLLAGVTDEIRMHGGADKLYLEPLLALLALRDTIARQRLLFSFYLLVVLFLSLSPLCEKNACFSHFFS